MPVTRFFRATVVLVGRPNVKSTLFNRITDSRRAIVTPIAGTTRDVNSLPAEWQGTTFRLVDTGGLFGASEDPLHELVVQQGRKALKTADVVVFVVDGREGLVPGYEEIARALRSVSVPVMMAVNKTDDKRARGRMLEFYQLGFEPVVEIAAEHGDGVGDLLDEIASRLPAGRDRADHDAADETAVAIVGRPNVGKSSLLNRLLREERSIVSEMPGTTRDTVDAVLKWHKRVFRIVDTAGIEDPAGWRAPASSSRSRSSWRARPSKRRMSRCSSWTRPKGRRTRTRRSRARPARPAAASSSRRQVGPHEGTRDRLLEGVRREASAPSEVPQNTPVLHISATTGERTGRCSKRSTKWRSPREEDSDLGAEPLHRRGVSRTRPRVRGAGKCGFSRGTDWSGPANVRVLTNVATEFHFSYQRYRQPDCGNHSG